jgi:hypothetical protein
MKLTLWVATLLALGLTQGCDRKATLGGDHRSEMEELEFRFEPSLATITYVWMAKTVSGEIKCAVYSISVSDNEGSGSQEPRLIRNAQVTPQVYEGLSTAFEEPSFRLAAEETPRGGMDGTNWVFRKKKGSRRLEYVFWTPEGRPAFRSSAKAMALGERFVEAAGLKGLLPPGNQSARPNPSERPVK